MASVAQLLIDVTVSGVSQATRALGSLNAAIGGAGVAKLAYEFTQAADAMALLEARLRLATGTTREYNAAQADLVRLANINSAGIQETVSLFNRLNDPVKRAGGSYRETTAIVNSFQKTLMISGASTGEAAAATIQFAQAMGKGALNGDEFNSIAEASPRLLKAIADGANLPIEQLKKLGSEGKLTADVVGNALIKMQKQLEREAALMPDTSGKAMTRLKNDVLLAVAEINKAVSYGTGLAGMIEDARSLVEPVKLELIDAFKSVSNWIDTNRESLREIGQQLGGIVADAWGLAKGLASVVGFLGQAAGETSVISTGLYAVRLVIAGIEDGVKIIGAAFAGVGADILDMFAKIGPAIYDTITAPLYPLKKAMAALGIEDPIRDAIASIGPGLSEMADAARKASNDVYDSFARGESAVERLKNEQQAAAEVTVDYSKKTADAALKTLKMKGSSEEAEKAAKKLQKAYESLVKTLNKDYAEALSAAIPGAEEMVDAQKKFLEIAASPEWKKFSETQRIAIATILERTAIQQQANKLEEQFADRSKQAADAINQETAARQAQIATDRQRLTLEQQINAAQIALMKSRASEPQQTDIFGNARLNTLEEELVLSGNLETALAELAVARAKERRERLLSLEVSDEEIARIDREIQDLEARAAISRARDEMAANRRIAEDRISKQKSATDQIKEIGIAGIRAMFDRSGEAGRQWIDKLKNDFKDRFAKAIYEQFAEPFIVNIVANLTGVTGQNGVSGVISSLFGGGGGGGAGGMNLGSILNIGKTLWSGFSQGFSGFTSQIGSLINTIGSNTGMSSVAEFGAGMRGGFTPAGGAAGWGSRIGSNILWIAAIAQGMKMSGQAYDEGYRFTEDTLFGKDNILSKTGKWATDAFTGEFTLKKIFGDKFAAMITGSSLTAKILDRIAGRGGPKAGGSFGLDVSSTGVISAGTLGRMFTPSDSDQALAEITDNLTKSFVDAMKALGGSASGAQFALGFDVDPKGKAQTRISSLTKVGGQDALVSFDRAIGKGTENLGAELEAETRKMLIAALKSSSLPDGVRQIIAKGIPDAVAASKEDIEKVLTDAAFWKVTFVDGAERIARQFGEKISYEAFSKLLEEGESLQSGISRISDVFDATNLVAVALGRDMNKAFGQIGLASFDARQQLINFSGGIQNLVSGTSAYYDNFFTDAEKAANITKQLTDEFGKYGLALPASRAEFRKLVESLDLTAEGGRKAYAELIGVAGAFDEMTKVAEESAKEAADAAKKAEEEAKKATEEAAKLLEEAAKRAADAIKLVGDIMDETARIGMTDYQRALADIDKTYRDHVQSLTDLGAATTENVAAAEALRKAQLTALEADRTKRAADGIAVFTKELERMGLSELDAGLADINDRYAEQMRVLLELDRATVANVSALDAWKRAMINAALTTSAVASGRRLVELQGGSLTGVDTALAEQGYSAALGGIAAEFGVTVGQVRDYLKQTGQSIESVALQYWSSLNDAQRRAVIIASDAKAAYIEALRAQFDAQTEMVQKQAADLSSVRALGSSIDQDIANLRVELGQTTREAVIAEQMAQIAREWQSNWTLKTIEEQVAAGEKYRSLIIERYQIELENATKLKQFAFSLGDYLKGLRIGNLSNLSLESRMLEARRQFEETRAAAAGGDERAQQKLTSSADTLLQLGREYYASSMGYTELFTFVTSSLEGLGAESATEAEKQLAVSNAQKAAAEKAVSELAYLRIGVNNAEKVVVSRLDTAIAEFKRLADKLLEEGAQNPVVAAINALPVAIRQQLAGLIPGAGITPTTPTPAAEKSYNINGQAYSSGALRIIAQPMLQNQDWTGIYNMAKSAGLRLSDINDILGQPAGTAEDVARRLGLPMFADGGVVTGPTMGLIGERGPEAIIPLADWSRYGRDPELIAEIRALRAEVSDLKREAARTASAAEAQIVQSGAQHVEAMAVATEQLRTDRDTNAEVKRMADRR